MPHALGNGALQLAVAYYNLSKLLELMSIKRSTTEVDHTTYHSADIVGGPQTAALTIKRWLEDEFLAKGRVAVVLLAL